MLLDQRCIDDIVRESPFLLTIDTDDGITIFELEDYQEVSSLGKTSIQYSISHIIFSDKIRRSVLKKLFEDLQTSGKVNAFLYAALIYPPLNKGTFLDAIIIGGLFFGIPMFAFDKMRSRWYRSHNSILEDALNNSLQSSPNTFDYSPTFQYGVVSEDKKYLVCYTLNPLHYDGLKRVLTRLGRVEEINQLDQTFAVWLEKNGDVKETLGDGGRDVDVKVVKYARNITELNVRVIKSNFIELRNEARVRTIVRKKLDEAGIKLKLPHTIGYVYINNERFARYDERIRGITLDEALRSRKYKSIALSFLPEVATLTGKLHYILGEEFIVLGKFDPSKELKKRFEDSNRYCKYGFLEPRDCDFLTSLTIFRVFKNIPEVVNLDSHPKQYIVVIDKRKGVSEIGRVDFELERMSSVPLINEVANLYRFGDYCGKTFEHDFNGLEAYVKAYKDLGSTPEELIGSKSLAESLKMAYLHSVIFRSLCFYSAWFDTKKRLFMASRIPEILSNIKYAMEEIKALDPNEFKRQQDQYIGLLGLLPALEKTAERARYW
ncbi:hypothetical protein HYY69_00540 [Candidatus Woesearchaeota archaeon]|nr:hypothetical protein [Candidatus Woesearchaeota archaeon]